MKHNDSESKLKAVQWQQDLLLLAEVDSRVDIEMPPCQHHRKTKQQTTHIFQETAHNRTIQVVGSIAAKLLLTTSISSS